jgi:hypothetical protein
MSSSLASPSLPNEVTLMPFAPDPSSKLATLVVTQPAALHRDLYRGALTYTAIWTIGTPSPRPSMSLR